MKKSEFRDYTLLRAKFRAVLLAKVAPFAARCDIRYYLNGIRVEAAVDRPGVYVIGCNGHTLLVAYDRDGMIENDDGKGILLKPTPGLVSACKQSGRGRKPSLDVVITGSRVSVSAGWGGVAKEGEAFVAPGHPFLEGAEYYPKWRRVLPVFEDLKPGIVNQVNAGYLAAFAKVADSHDRWHGIRLWQAHENGSCLVEMAAFPELLGVIMPMRNEPSREAVIRGFRAIAERQEEAA